MSPMTPKSSDRESAISANKLPYATESMMYWMSVEAFVARSIG